MKKLLLFIAGISILFLAGCYNGNQSHGNEIMGDSLPADPPLGYVIELKPLGNFSHQEAEQLREELVKQLGFIFNKVPKAWVEASVFVGDKKEIPDLEGTKRSVYLRESPKMMEEPRIEIVR